MDSINKNLDIGFPILNSSFEPSVEESVNGKAEIQRVLEHISSNFRWELLDMPVAKKGVVKPYDAKYE